MRARLTDHDKTFGPVTFGPTGHWRALGLCAESGDDENSGCSLMLYARRWVIRLALPQIVPPYRERIHADWDAATVARLGRDWYWHVDSRQFGFLLSDGYLSLFYGRQSDDSSTERRRGWFLPWTQWRFVRHSFFGLDGEHLRTDRESSSFEVRRAQSEAQTEFRELMLPKAHFEFVDFDGAHITASAYIEEREWRFGTGLFRWLSLFRRPKVRRSLDIWFSAEVGPKKGSWKGGMRGHGIEMLPDELHEAAFRRYCAEHDLRFVGPIELSKSAAEDAA